MAKINSVALQGAKGKIGKVVYSTQGGETIARQLVTPKNTKTDAQTLQRVIAKQVGTTYTKFKDLCNHSFEGYTTGMKSMNRFRELNMLYARQRAAEIQQSGQSLSAYYNFQPIKGTKWVPGAAIISQGSLNAIVAGIVQASSMYVGQIPTIDNTYEGLCLALNAKRGDQLTFVTVEKVNGEYQVFKTRVILDPRNADGSGAAMSSDFAADGGINLPNWRNSGTFTFLNADDNLKFKLGPSGSVLVACAVIASRKDNSGKWFRSNAQLTLSEAACGEDLCSLYDAVNDSYAASDIELENELYLNNAGTGGTQGSDSGVSPTPADPDGVTFSDSVRINNASQSVAGGSVNVTSETGSIAVQINGSGFDADEDKIAVYKKNGGAATEPDNVTPTSMMFNITGLTPGNTLTFYKNGTGTGTPWFTLNFVAANDPELDG